MSLLGAAGCGGTDPAPAPPVEEAPAAEESLKLYVFECGRLRFDTVERFSIADDETDVRELIVPCYVVDHPDGTLLWDGGLPSAVAENDGWGDNNQRLDRTFAEQLAEYDLGVDLGSFDYVAFSHIHFDHVGVAGELTGGTWLVQQGDLDAAFPEGPGAEAAEPLLDNMRNLERMVLDGDHDVFGDGRVRIISSPGHTPGHQVLFLDLDERDRPSEARPVAATSTISALSREDPARADLQFRRGDDAGVDGEGPSRSRVLWVPNGPSHTFLVPSSLVTSRWIQVCGLTHSTQSAGAEKDRPVRIE